MPEPLGDYRAKRDLTRTPEPEATAPQPSAPSTQPASPAGTGRPAQGDRARFVVQEHHARSMHWDLRLERDGVLVSWAVPRGIPPDPARNHLAVHTEDHPLEYLDFHGEIPAGQYGAGTMSIWDRGTYETHKFREDEVMVTFHGDRVQGRYVLFRTGGKNWMIHRMDPPQDPGREPMPERVAPMLARSGDLPSDDDRWGFEIKWDGVRAIVYAQGGRLRLESRNGNDITARYPELRGLGRALGAREAVLDGEVVAFDEDGRPSFQRLQGRMHLSSERAVRRKSEEEPVVLVLFDLLHLDGRSLMGLPYAERREALSGLGLSGPAWQAPAHHVGDGAALLALSRERGLEGIVAKRLDCPYTPGRRSSHWIKVKNVRDATMVIGGWLPGEGNREQRLGALLVGFHEDDRLVLAGRVGTGFTESELDCLGRRLAHLATPESPFTGRQPPRQARFVSPEMVCDVGFSEWTHARTLRHPVYRGLRDDVDPARVRFPGAD